MTADEARRALEAAAIAAAEVVARAADFPEHLAALHARTADASLRRMQLRELVFGSARALWDDLGRPAIEERLREHGVAVAMDLDELFPVFGGALWLAARRALDAATAIIEAPRWRHEGRSEALAVVAPAPGGGVLGRSGPRRIGTASAGRRRLLAAVGGALVCLEGDWTTRVEAGEGWTRAAVAAPDRPPPIALCRSGDRLWAVAAGGAVLEWSAGQWSERGPASSTFGDWPDPVVAADAAGRLIAWGAGGGQAHTLVFERGAWRFLPAAGGPEWRRDVGYQAVWSPERGAVVLIGDGEVARFDAGAGRWSPAPRRSSPLDREQRLVLGDPVTGVLLGVDLKNRCCVRIGAAGDAVVAELERPGEQVDLPSPDPAARPLAADWVFEPERRELLLFVDDDLDERYALDLGPVLDHAAAQPEPEPRPEPASIAGPPAAERAAAEELAPEGGALPWRRFGPAPPRPDIETPPRREATDYVLSYDGSAGAIRYVRCRPHRFGDSWLWDGEAWRRDAGRADAPAVEHHFRAVYDPSLDGVGCWSVRRDGRAVGFLAAPGGPRPIETRGETPLREPHERESRHHMLFGFHRGEGATFALTSRGLWLLDTSRVWYRRADFAAEGPFDGRWNEGRLAGAAWDSAGGRIIAWFYRRGSEALHMAAVEGGELVAIDPSGLPDGVSSRRPPVIGDAGELGLVALAGDPPGLYRLAGDRWEPFELGAGAPPAGRGVALARDPARDLLMLGPGHYDGVAQHVFHVLGSGAWRRHGTLQPEANRPFHVEILADTGAELLGMGRSNDCWVWSDERAWIEGAPWDWVGAPVSVRAGGLGAGGQLEVVTQKGGVHRLEDGAWHACPVDREAFVDRHGAVFAHDRAGDRWLAWHGDERAGASTLLLEDGAWRAVGPQPGPLPAELAGGAPRLVQFALVFDAFLGRFVRIGPDEIAVLEGDRWVAVAASPSLAGMSGHRLVVHDEGSGETLVIDVESRRIGRFDLAAVTPIASYRLPEGFVDPEPGASFPTFPYSRQTPYHPEGRRLLAFDPYDHFGNYELDLAPAIAAAAALGPRTRL